MTDKSWDECSLGLRKSLPQSESDPWKLPPWELKFHSKSWNGGICPLQLSSLALICWGQATEHNHFFFLLACGSNRHRNDDASSSAWTGEVSWLHPRGRYSNWWIPVFLLVTLHFLRFALGSNSNALMKHKGQTSSETAGWMKNFPTTIIAGSVVVRPTH